MGSLCIVPGPVVPFGGVSVMVVGSWISTEPARPQTVNNRSIGPLTAIADLSAKAYSHNCARVQRHLCPARKAPTNAPQAAGVDAGLYGGTRGNGPEFHFGFGKRKEGNLHPQSGTACHCLRYDRLKAHVASLRLHHSFFRRDLHLLVQVFFMGFELHCAA